MNVKTEFLKIMAEQTEIALATSVDNIPNVRIVNFYFLQFLTQEMNMLKLRGWLKKVPKQFLMLQSDLLLKFQPTKILLNMQGNP